jgi:hypothetical protein
MVATVLLQISVSFVLGSVSTQQKAALLSAVNSIVITHSPTDYITTSVHPVGYSVSSRDDPYFKYDLEVLLPPIPHIIPLTRRLTVPRF